MQLELQDKVVLVTGGSKGIGLACAQGFAREGAKVAITARDAAQLEAARALLQADAGHVLAIAADLSDPAQAARVVADTQSAFGPVDVLVNSAGAAKRATPAELTAAHWHAAMQAKYFTYIHAMQAVLPAMAERGHGAIVNVVGMGGRVASPTHLAGGSANAALLMATVGLAKAYAPQGVRINAVNPGTVETGRVAQRVQAQARLENLAYEEVLRRQAESLPMRRMARPEEVADVVMFLASARASYVAGAVVAMDGGASGIV
ncbi:SDR family oxidoreductase [Bordetella genomosp. 13]|uniref:SDR family oxidoreductase n=1 Tax=Bordetella genomosp. 13 TaxID=463040 RepID=UPI0011A7FD67|nr:SDR family oxidoreductase [Bordetella genomosp. 13]